MMNVLTMISLQSFQSKTSKQEQVMKDVMVVGHGAPTKIPKLLIISFPDSKKMKLVANTILLALIIAALPSLGSAIRELGSDVIASITEIKTELGTTNQEALHFLFHELSNEGHLKEGGRVLVITRDNDGNIYDSHSLGNNNEIEFVSNTDIKGQSSFPNEYFDFVFTQDLPKDTALIDRTLKVNGIVTYKYTCKVDHVGKFQGPSNYGVVYRHQFDSTEVVALKKMEKGDKNTNRNLPKRRLLGITTANGKKDVLENLEDVLLEPPRAFKSKSYLKKTKYLPDLMGDSLESYSRRVLIVVGPPKKTVGDLGWFANNYPKRRKAFEIYKVSEVSSGDGAQVGMSDWLKSHVKEEEYVVMKAEAEVVEDMVKNNALALVDELFLECRYQGGKGKSKRSRRAYWECLALYGRLRDEGVAVHQWWG